MPFLDAKALETDPDGMAFLRSVIRPKFEKEEAASTRSDAPPTAQPAQRDPAEPEPAPVRSEAAVAVC